jgi:hypothetical protein
VQDVIGQFCGKSDAFRRGFLNVSVESIYPRLVLFHEPSAKVLAALVFVLFSVLFFMSPCLAVTKMGTLSDDQKLNRQKPIDSRQLQREQEKRKVREREARERLARIEEEIEEAEQKKRQIEEDIAELRAAYEGMKKNLAVEAIFEPSKDRLIVRRDGTVVDRATKRMWLKDANYPMRGMSWEEAVKYCEELTYAGYKDWRLPSRREWEVLIGKDTGIDMVFPGGHPFENIVVHASYWSSTPNPPGHAYTYSVNVVSGSVESLKIERTGYVWPVRYMREADLLE